MHSHFVSAGVHFGQVTSKIVLFFIIYNNLFWIKVSRIFLFWKRNHWCAGGAKGIGVCSLQPGLPRHPELHPSQPQLVTRASKAAHTSVCAEDRGRVRQRRRGVSPSQNQEVINLISTPVFEIKKTMFLGYFDPEFMF